MSQTDPTGVENSRAAGSEPKVVIKKYANRRLYNTDSSSYVTLDHLAQMVRDGTDFVVYDAKSNDDITRSVLAQIIFEEESHGQNLLPPQFLRQLIRFYGGSMQAFLPSYLELSLDSFARRQDQMRKDIGAAAGGADVLELYQTQVRQNLALFDRAMKMFTPFSGAAAPAAEPEPPATAAASPAAGDSLADMRAQLDRMQKQIEALAAKG